MENLSKGISPHFIRRLLVEITLADWSRDKSYMAIPYGLKFEAFHASANRLGTLLRMK